MAERRRNNARESRQQMSEKISRFDMGGFFRRISRQTKVFIISFLLVVAVFIGAYKFVEYKYLAPVSKRDTTPIEVVIPRRSSMSAIATILEEAGVIRSAGAFKIYLDLNDKSGKLKAGTYELTKSMSLAQITDELTSGISTEGVVTIRLTEGKTVDDLAEHLVSKGVLKDTTSFLESMKTGQKYMENNYVAASSGYTGTKYVMEGYLFPDTYQIYADDTEEAIIQRFLTRFDNIYTAQYESRATELKMSTHDVITLASMIEKEARTGDFKKVSAVFHNRLKQNMALGSCATAQYMLDTNKLVLSAEQRNTESPYNTYLKKGLPIGPICNPGKAAIEAALWPDEAFMKEGYLYFCNGEDPSNGELVFAKTAEDHRRNEEKYRPFWNEYDKKQEK
ncbi:endolytic transglycosylase MltG [Eubacteriales bacterium OttesenSCG-928-M02]|nr:endolytic transglycosylase MltG [Eubacteriales bacterium OttesenSCG-928-M02]